MSDINLAMLEEGRSRMVDAGHVGNVEYMQINAEAIPFPDNSFDCVTIAFGLRNVTDKDLALRSMLRVLKPGGRFFMHVFCHREHPYPYEDTGPDDWMSHYFFAGGIMPSDDLPLRFQDRLQLHRRWRWNGRHYERTSNAWLANMDARRDEVMPILEQTYGSEAAGKWFQRWRIFFMACAELFGLDEGREWYVGHYLFRRSEDANNDRGGAA